MPASPTPKMLPMRADDSPIALPLAELESERYSRQILFPGVGPHGQAHLARSHAAIIGCGATGAATASLLARAGVGTLTLIDRDFVEPSNLQRQILFDEQDAVESRPKAEAARRHIALFNSAVTVHSRIADLTPTNIAELLGSHHGIDLLLDCTDNFETRYLLNDFAVQQGVPWIYAAAVGSYAATMTILPHTTACLSCLFPDPPTGPVETCDSAGILSTAVNLAASLQTTEALKLLTHQPHFLRRTFFSFDLWTGERSEINTATPNSDCPTCAHRRFPHLTGVGRPHITLCGRNSVQIHEHNRPLDLAAMHFRLAAHPDIHDLRANSLLLRFRRDIHTLTLFADGRAIIQGTTDPAVARAMYTRFIGM